MSDHSDFFNTIFGSGDGEPNSGEWLDVGDVPIFDETWTPAGIGQGSSIATWDELIELACAHGSDVEGLRSAIRELVQSHDNDGGDDDPPRGKASTPPRSSDEPAPSSDTSSPAAPPTGPPSADCAQAGTALPRLEQALGMAARGFRVLPLSPGSKVPLAGVPWKQDATTDAAIIRRWFDRTPDMNYGVAGGAGLLIVDVDAGKGGFASLIDLDLPTDTLTVTTPGGGCHLYLRGDDVATTVDRVAPGIDIRSAGGYVVGPGSYFGDEGGSKGYTGRYAITLDVPLADAPAAFLLRCGEQRKREDGPPLSVDEPDDVAFAVRYLWEDAPASIKGQGGNNTAYAVAARVLEMGVSVELAIELMLRHWNGRCPPGWAPDRLRLIVEHAATYMTSRKGSGGVTALAEQGGDPADVVTLPVTPAAAPASLGEWIDFDTSAVPVQWLVKRLLPVEGAGFLTGLPNAGKSALAFDLADALARRSEWFGHPIRRQSGTIVLAFEGGKAHTLLRLRALLTANGGTPPAVAVRYLDGLARDQLSMLPAIIRQRAAEMEQVHRFPVRLLVLDTLGASGLLDDENDNAEIQRVFGELRKLGRSVGMFVLVVHHPTKSQSDDLSGGGALRRTADVVIRASYEEGKPVRELRVVKTREGVTGPLGAYKTRGVVAGTDEDGEPATAVVIDAVRAAEPGPSLENRLRARIAVGPDGPGSYWRKSNQSEDAIDRAFADELGYRYDIVDGRLKMDSPAEKRHVAELIKGWIGRRWLVEFESTDVRGNRRWFIRIK